MILTLKRKWLTDKSTIGELFVDGDFECFILEDVLRAPGVKIKGKTAIPAGRYEIILNHSNRFKVVMPLLLRVPMFDGIRIHPLNTPEQTEGCLGPGLTRGENFVGQSRVAYSRLFNKLARAALVGKIWIEIHSPADFRITAPSMDFSSPGQGKVAIGPEKSSHEATRRQIPAFPVSASPGFSPSVPAQTPVSRAADSLKTGNTLPVLVSAFVAARDFLQQNYRWILLWLILCILSALAYYEFKHLRKKQ